MTDTIVMIHGMWGGGWYWDNYAKYFEEKGYRCITPTLPFHVMDPNASPDPQLGNTIFRIQTKHVAEYKNAALFT
jgi:dienelactone hydrolase